jgi:hypothetical protein
MSLPKALCLNMIVKNETANLERCLKAVAGHISCWVIGDTGSVDGTQELIEQFFAARGIPGELHSFPFENFAQARNEALNRARASSLKFDYLLLTDADMELTVQDPAFASKLDAAAYKVLQNSGVSYWNNRLLRRDVPADYKGVTHEYLDVRAGETKNLDGIRFIDHATGANRVDKYDRDIRLLRDAIRTETDADLTTRYNFYLANTFRDSGQKEAALAAYLKRASLGGWEQEVFMSLLNAAKLKEELEFPHEEVIAGFQAATASCPTRAEALHAASQFCRNQKLYEQGYQFAARGLKIPYPDDALFVEDWAYDYGLLDEFSVNAYWTGRYEDCIAACDRLLSEGKLPESHRDRVLNNKIFAVDRQREIAAAPAGSAYFELLRRAREKEQLAPGHDEVIAAYLEAAAAAPGRAEALHDAARYCRNNRLYDRGYEFAVQGLAKGRPDDVPAAEAWIYEYGLLQELSIVANYARDPGRKDRGFAACNWLSLNREIAADARYLATSNLYFYMLNAATMMPSFVTRPVQFEAPDGYHPLNPSVTRSGDQLVLIQRAVNYTIDHSRPHGDQLQYEVPDGIFRTRNFISHLSDDLVPQSFQEILPPADMPEPAFARNLGFQDIRPFIWRGELWCSAYVVELTSEGWYQQVLARVDVGTPDEVRLTDWRVLTLDGERRHEKNWMPRITEDALEFIYSCDPLRLIDDQARMVSKTNSPIMAEGFRGGSQAIAFDGGWLALVHEVRVRDSRRQYRHRFIWLDETNRLRRVSRPFFFHEQGVEFAAGLAWHPDGRRLLISYGVNDRESWIADVDANDVKRILDDAEQLPSGGPFSAFFETPVEISAAPARELHFIVGVPRSGTTLFRAMLGAHPRICAPSETPWLTGAYGGGPSFLEFMQNLATSDSGPVKNIRGVSMHDITRAAENFLWELFATKMQAEGKDVLVLKTPDDIWFVDQLIKFFPRAKILHVRRDVRDVALSTIGLGWRTLNHFGENSFANAVRRWVACERKIADIAATNDNIASFHFEEFTAEPQAELTRAAEFLNLSFDAKMLDYAQHLTDAPSWEAGSCDVKRHGAIKPARALAHRNVAPTAEQSRIIKSNAADIEALGYSADWQSDMAPIPNIFHFITGLDENFGGKPFSFIHYMAIRSALQANPGFRAKVYYHFEPSGDYWDAIKPDVEAVRVELPDEVFGNPVEHFAHKADVLRMRILLEQGGIYLDLDTICQRPFEPLLDGRVVMGREERILEDGSRLTVGLCNATIIAPPNAEFLRLWYETYRDFKGGPSGDGWNKFSVQVPMQLATERPELLRIEPAASFFWPSWDSAGLHAMFSENHDFPEAFSFHLWESHSWHLAENLDAAAVLSVDTTYNKIARRFVAGGETMDQKQPLAWPSAASGAVSAVNADLARAAYRVILGREPESETAINWHIRNGANPEALLRNFVNSAEYKFRSARGGSGVQETLLEFLSNFTPRKAVGHVKTRIGNQESDGGYVMLDDFNGITAAVSAGIGNDVSWDQDIAGRGIDIYQFDHTVEAPPVPHERFRFFPHMVAPQARNGTESIKSMIEKIPDTEGRLILKIDIEGAEWEAFDAVDIDDFRRVAQIVGEFHDFDHAAESDWRGRTERVIRKLNKVFQIVHLHGNNWQPLSVIANVPFPSVIELTFANRSMYQFEETDEIFPTSLDRPNRPDRADIFLGSLDFARNIAVGAQ